MLLLILLIVVGITLIWALWARNWLKAQPWGWSQALFAWLDPFEVAVYKKSETILVARTKMVVGVVLTMLQQFDGVDITPIMPLLPEKYQGYIQIAINLLPLTLTLIGMMDERLRNTTTQPLELVALSDKELAKPEVAAAVVEATATKEAAVDVVTAAKAEGTT